MAKVPLIIKNDEELAAALDRAEVLYGAPASRKLQLDAIAEAVHVYTDAMRPLRSLAAKIRPQPQKRGYFNA